MINLIHPLMKSLKGLTLAQQAEALIALALLVGLPVLIASWGWDQEVLPRKVIKNRVAYLFFNGLTASNGWQRLWLVGSVIWTVLVIVTSSNEPEAFWIWLVPVCFAYLLGLAGMWIRRGFQQ